MGRGGTAPYRSLVIGAAEVRRDVRGLLASSKAGVHCGSFTSLWLFICPCSWCLTNDAFSQIGVQYGDYLCVDPGAGAPLRNIGRIAKVPAETEFGARSFFPDGPHNREGNRTLCSCLARHLFRKNRAYEPRRSLQFNPQRFLVANLGDPQPPWKTSPRTRSEQRGRLAARRRQGGVVTPPPFPFSDGPSRLAPPRAGGLSEQTGNRCEGAASRHRLPRSPASAEPNFPPGPGTVHGSARRFRTRRCPGFKEAPRRTRRPGGRETLPEIERLVLSP